MTVVVSIITPAFNAERTICQAIQSVQAQSFLNWEMLVVDDGSSDDTAAIVEQFMASDSRIRLQRQLENSGPARARNAALQVARGRYIAFLDSDDVWLPEKLERQLAFMTANEVAMSFTLYRRFDAENGEVGPLVVSPAIFTYSMLLKHTGIACLTVMLDRELTGPVEFPDVRHEDYAFWLQLLKKGIIAYGVMEDQARYRVAATSISGNKLQSAAWVWNIYRDVEKLSWLRASWCLLNYAWNAYKRDA